MVSVNAAGAPTTTGGGSFVLGVSANGQFVAFHSTATDLVAGVTDTNGSSDIFVRDMKNGVTHLVTVTNTGANTPTFGSFFQMMSENGHKVVFTNTKTTEMVTGFTDGNGESCCTAPDLFVRDIMKGTTTLVNVNLAGTGSGNGGVGQGEGISPNGRFVVFSSNANNLIAVDPPHFIDATNIYIRDLIKGTTKIVTVNVSGDNRVGGNNGSFFPRVSNNGQFVLFSSSATNLTGLPKPNLTYVYLRDMNEAAQEPVSINSAGTAMGNSSAATLIPALLSNNGKFVVFNSFASDLVTNDTNGHSDLFVRNMNAGATSLVSINSAGTDSGGGAVFPFTPSSPHVLSSNGRVVAFDSRANDLVTNDGNTFIDVFVRNLQ
jgi:Tol biopolymer transport system component